MQLETGRRVCYIFVPRKGSPYLFSDLLRPLLLGREIAMEWAGSNAAQTYHTICFTYVAFNEPLSGIGQGGGKVVTKIGGLFLAGTTNQEGTWIGI